MKIESVFNVRASGTRAAVALVRDAGHLIGFCSTAGVYMHNKQSASLHNTLSLSTTALVILELHMFCSVAHTVLDQPTNTLAGLSDRWTTWR